MNKSRMHAPSLAGSSKRARFATYLFRMCQLWYGSNDRIPFWKYFEVQVFAIFLALAMSLTSANGTS